MPKTPKLSGSDVVEVRFCPLPRQLEFFRMCASHRFALFLGGLQSGKTTAGAIRAWMHVIENKEPKRGWVVSPTYAMSEIPERDFANIIPKAISGIRRDAGRRIYTIENGYTVEFKTADEPDKLRGERLGWVWMDEGAMVSREVFDILLGRVLTHKGSIFITTTPRGRNWLYDDFYLKSSPNLPGYDSDYGVVRSLTSENTYLDPKEVCKLKKKYSGPYGRQELEAEFVSFEGLVFPQFDLAKHLCAELLPSDPRISQVVSGIDFGYNDPFVCLWLVRKDGRWILADEYYCPGRPIDHHAQMVMANPWEKKVQARFCDYHNKEARHDLLRYGMATVGAGMAKPINRIIEIGRLLANDLPDGKPELLVCSNCTNAIREFGSYRYRDATSARDPGEIPQHQSDHAMDALGYALYGSGGMLYHGPEAPDAEAGKPGPGTWGWIKNRMNEKRRTEGLFQRPWAEQDSFFALHKT